MPVLPSLMASVQSNLDEAKAMPRLDIYDQAKDLVEQYLLADCCGQTAVLDGLMSGGDKRDCLYCVALIALGKLGQVQAALARLPDAGGAK